MILTKRNVIISNQIKTTIRDLCREIKVGMEAQHGCFLL
jgi:hypothetical protein